MQGPISSSNDAPVEQQMTRKITQDTRITLQKTVILGCDSKQLITASFPNDKKRKSYRFNIEILSQFSPGKIKKPTQTTWSLKIQTGTSLKQQGDSDCLYFVFICLNKYIYRLQLLHGYSFTEMEISGNAIDVSMTTYNATK